MNRGLSVDLVTQQRLVNRASYITLVAMQVCLAVTYVQLLRWVTRGWPGLQWDHLPFLALLVAAEAIFTLPIVRELEGHERWVYHFSEWVTFAICLKLVGYFIHGLGNLSFDLVRWQQDIFTFFEGEYLFTLALLVVVWQLGRASAIDLEALNVDPADLEWEFGKLQNSRASVRSSLVGRILWTGIFMVVMAAGVRANIAATLGAVSQQEPVLNILIYFFLALVLFSQTQYLLLTSRWYWHQTPATAQMSRSWLRYGLIFFAIIATVAFVLPTNYSLGLLETLNFLVSWGMAALFFIIQVIFLPILWLISLSGCTRQTGAPTVETPAPFSNFPSPGPPAAIPWLELLQSILFWGLFIALIGYALFQFVRQNSQWVNALKPFPGLFWLSSLFRWLRNWLKGSSAQVIAGFKEISRRLTFTREKSLLTNPPVWPNFRQRTPRQQILFYYLRLLERSSKHGVKRMAAETPNQYASSLVRKLPEVQEDIAGITQTFIEARYSTHIISPERSSLVQRFWRNITRSLKHLQPPKQPPE